MLSGPGALFLAFLDSGDKFFKVKACASQRWIMEPEWTPAGVCILGWSRSQY